MSGELVAAPGEPQAAPPPVIEVEGLGFSWPVRPRFTLEIARFALGRGERLLLVGPSGSGKSTLLALLTGIVVPRTGRLAVLGQELAGLPGAARDRFRVDHMGIIFQMFNLLPYGTVLDNVLLPLGFSAARRARAAERGGSAAEARRLLAALGLEASLVERAGVRELSVGQQQRIAAARALIGSPELILADEPTSALDRDRQQAFLDLLLAEVERSRASLVMVSRDESLAARFSRVVRLPDIARTSREVAA